MPAAGAGGGVSKEGGGGGRGTAGVSCTPSFGPWRLLTLVALLVTGPGLPALSSCSRGRVRSRTRSWESRSVHPREAMAPRALCRMGGLDVSWFPLQGRSVWPAPSLPPLGPQQTIDRTIDWVSCAHSPHSPCPAHPQPRPLPSSPSEHAHWWQPGGG